MGKGTSISWRTANGTAHGEILQGDGASGYLVLLANGRHAIVCPDYQPAPRRQNKTNQEEKQTQ